MKNIIKTSCDTPCQTCAYPFDQNLLGHNCCPNCLRNEYAAIDAAESRAELAECARQGVPIRENGTPFSF